MRNGRRRLVVAWAWLALGASGGAYAQLPAGGEFQINGYTTEAQELPSVAMDANGDFVVVWRSEDQDGFAGGLRQRRFRADGTPKSGGLAVNSYTTNDQSEAAVASDGAGSFVVAWVSWGQEALSGAGIFAQRYDASGAAQGPEFRVNAYTPGDQRGPRLALDASGNFVVVWWSEGQDGSGAAVRGRRFDAQGAPVGGGFQVNTYTTGDQIEPAVASTANGGFVVVWSSDGQDGNEYGVFGRLYDASGAPLGGEFPVNAYTTSHQLLPDVAVDPSGRFVVVWQSFGEDGSSGGIFGRRFDASGAPIGSEFAVNTYTTSNQNVPRVAVAADGSFTVVWYSAGQPGGSVTDVVGQRFDASGAPLGGEFTVNTYTTSNQSGPAIAMDPDGDFIVAWQSEGTDGDLYGISGQRYGDLIFQDNFESDGVSRWSVAVTDGTDLDVTTGGMGGTTLGVQAFVDDTGSLYLQDDSPADEARYRVRFYFDPNGFDPGEVDGKRRVRICIVFNGTSQRLATIVLRRISGDYSVMARVRRDDGTRMDTGFFSITDEPHSIEFDWRRATAAGANDGAFDLWIDDALLSTLTGIDNDGSGVEFTRMGVMTIKTAAANGTLGYDQFESRRLNPIGPE